MSELDACDRALLTILYREMGRVYGVPTVPDDHDADGEADDDE